MNAPPLKTCSPPEQERQSDPEFERRKAAEALWTLFDASYAQIRGTSEQCGEPCCISTVRTPNSRRYWRAHQDGSQRSIALALMLAMVEGALRGGAFVTTSRPYLSLFIVPVFDRELVHWLIGTGGVPLTAAIVQDLFLSVLHDDLPATQRLVTLAVYALG